MTQDKPIPAQPATEVDAAGHGLPVLVGAFYKFVHVGDIELLRPRLQAACEARGLLGTILLAEEGINGTIAGDEAGMRDFFAQLRTDARFSDLEVKQSRAAEQPFHRIKVRHKKEIVTLGVPGIDPVLEVGEYIDAADWNQLISRDDVRLVDTRNRYEVHLGSFEGAEDPDTDAFRDFPAWVDANLDPARDRHVATFCTGGIRCEKATAYLRSKGFEHVYHLRGGILKYLEEVRPEDSLWQGDCFVFDNRVTVDHQLRAGDYELCPACRMPLSDSDRAAPEFELHVSCPKCFHRLTPERREGLLERARQMALAEARGERHLGQPQPAARPGAPRQDVPDCIAPGDSAHD